jgi:hypothetical protein
MTIGWRRPQPPDGEDGQQDGDREHHGMMDTRTMGRRRRRRVIWSGGGTMEPVRLICSALHVTGVYMVLLRGRMETGMLD